jgi:hypothetical protein
LKERRKVEKPKRKIKKAIKNSALGVWSENEHTKFIEGLTMHGKDWKRVKKVIKTRNLQQISAHADRFIRKIKKTPSLVSKKIFKILLGDPTRNPSSFDNRDKEKVQSQTYDRKSVSAQKETKRH